VKQRSGRSVTRLSTPFSSQVEAVWRRRRQEKTTTGTTHTQTNNTPV